ncbi:MAG: hypothetical protein M0P01_12710 [Treponema sp.]|nr:hypothetical protein [Treponema sp.]
MKKTFSVHAAVILTALTLAAAPVFAADTTNTAAAPAATTTAAPAAATTTAAPAKKATAKKAVAKKAATIKVPVISVSKYGEKTAGAFTVTWTDASSGKYTYTLDRAEADKNGKLTGKFAAAAAATNTDSAYTVTDTVDAGKYYKYRLIASEGNETAKGTVSKTESSVTAEAPAATAPAVKK